MPVLFSKLPIVCMALLLDLVSAHPGKNLSTAFHVPHGCSGSSTISVTAVVPENIATISAGAVSNWTLSIGYRDTSNSSISSFTWSGGYLQANDALDFPIALSAPNVDLSSNSNVTYYFPFTQVCENSTVNWTDIPSSGVDSETLKHPAPTLVLVKNATEASKDSTAINQSSDAHSSDAYSLGLGSFPLIVTISALAMLL
ncbi:hypothetical protein G6F56_004399 [Rhizopus delemar]|uniref:YncI copper-binding domain-containing protein n=1 Tax=Rhizopus stolonifer TaxID=4846 RepID=A0A367IJA0_RHIST|nr:hypothetical protein G6F56_004399 [Rhizopus delemar]RCH77743.1 hypothetical protein CU098_004744 [Rhizopus stolonifer]